MKSRVRNEQTRCSVACGEKSFVLEFLFLFVQAKRKHTVFCSLKHKTGYFGKNDFF